MQRAFRKWGTKELENGAGRGDTGLGGEISWMSGKESRLDLSQGFQFMSVSHTGGKKGKEGLPRTPCKKWVVLTSLFSCCFFFFFLICPIILKQVLF